MGIAHELATPRDATQVASAVSPFVETAQRFDQHDVSVALPQGLNREEKLAHLAQLVQDTPLIELPDPVIVDLALTTDTQPATSNRTIKYCGDSRPPFEVISIPSPSEFRLVEGARLLVTTVLSSTTKTLLQLPFSYTRANQIHCIPQQVVGVSIDGRPIYNMDVAVWQAWSPGAIIGYALDGLPIVRADTAATDECGGGAFASGYAYLITDSSEAVLFCYREEPIRISLRE